MEENCHGIGPCVYASRSSQLTLEPGTHYTFLFFVMHLKKLTDYCINANNVSTEISITMLLCSDMGSAPPPPPVHKGIKI